MIKVERTEKPKVLKDNAEKWLSEYLTARSNYLKNKTSKNKKILDATEKKYNNKAVKEALKTMFFNKCVFCESKITHIDYGEIEHFKPKSKYPDYCFEWENLLLSCSICNGKANKGDKFPLEDENGPLINPVEENPDNFFKFEFDVNANLFMIFPKNERAKTLLKIIKLNRDDLAEKRTLDILKIKMFKEEILKSKPEKIIEFKKMFSPKDEYYAFIKNIL
jgi:uncharacterized protein (TIGR02646 family)